MKKDLFFSVALMCAAALFVADLIPIEVIFAAKVTVISAIAEKTTSIMAIAALAVAIAVLAWPIIWNVISNFANYADRLCALLWPRRRRPLLAATA